jgi:hypothetical protein
MSVPVSRLNQHQPGVLALRSVGDETRQRRVREAFIAIADVLPARPKPAWVWNDCARPVGESRGALFVTRDVEVIRQALAAAHAIGPAQLREMKARVREYLEEKRDAMLAGFEMYELDLSAFASEATCVVAKETAEVFPALVEARERPSEGSFARLRREASEAIEALRVVMGIGHAMHEDGRRPAA